VWIKKQGPKKLLAIIKMLICAISTKKENVFRFSALFGKSLKKSKICLEKN
jgi:hypothetical protein